MSTHGTDPGSPVRVSAANTAPVVLLAGLGSTLLALALVWAISRYGGENVMGWYASFVLPVGAIFVGMVASTGFGVASWATGTRISGGLLVAVAVTLFVGYWAAQYVAFRVEFPDGATLADGREAGLLDLYDLVTRSFAWKDHGGKLGAALGAWGYLLRAGEIVGFCGGGLLAPVVLRNVPYCSSCGVYMRQPVVAMIPAGLPPRKVSKKDAAGLAAREAEAAEAFGRGEAALETVLAAGRAGDAAAFAAAIDQAGPLSSQRAANKLSTRIQVRVVSCRRCTAGALNASVVTGQGQEIRITPFRTQPLERGVAPRLGRRG